MADIEDLQKMLYLELLKSGYKLNEIDSMDIHYYMHLMSVKNQKSQTYIDDIF